MITDIPHTDLAHQIHADNITAGWWTNIATGESIIETRNRPEMLMLIVSEISEACDGWVNDLMDDKLPHLPMFDVEMADVAIRTYDLLGCDAKGMNFDRAVRGAQDNWKHHLSVTTQLMQMVNWVSYAMEGHRKGNKVRYLDGLFHVLGGAYAVCAAVGSEDLAAVIETKRSFNRNRSDHKIENRLKDDGKKF